MLANHILKRIVFDSFAELCDEIVVTSLYSVRLEKRNMNMFQKRFL